MDAQIAIILYANKQKLINICKTFNIRYEDQEDIVSDVILLLSTKYNRSNFPTEGKLLSTASVTVKNFCINKYRRNTKFQVEEFKPYHTDSTKFNKSPEELFIIDEILNYCNSVVYCEELRLLSLGYKYAEIAEILNIPIGTVKSRVFHTRKLLKQKLNK